MMQLNEKVFKNVEKAGAQVLVVTKYFERNITLEILEKIKNKKCFLALGENRIEALEVKKLPREQVHFIGRIQSRKISKIVEYCSTVHSLDNLKHAEKLNNIIDRFRQQSLLDIALPWKKFNVFLQVNISEEIQKCGVMPNDFSSFVKKVQNLSNLEILGISGMGCGIFNEKQKREEFLKLKKLRDEFLPGTKISAGTSRDYTIALEEGIEIVRVGQACFRNK